jgi:hypothetical protein
MVICMSIQYQLGVYLVLFEFKYCRWELIFTLFSPITSWFLMLNFTFEMFCMYRSSRAIWSSIVWRRKAKDCHSTINHCEIKLAKCIAYPIGLVFSIDLTHKCQMHPYDYHNDEKLKNNDYPLASQWRLLQMNAPEWKRALHRCLGAACYRTIHPIHAYCLEQLSWFTS